MEERACIGDAPQDCVWSPWTEGVCSETLCGVRGVQHNTRTHKYVPYYENIHNNDTLIP